MLVFIFFQMLNIFIKYKKFIKFRHKTKILIKKFRLSLIRKNTIYDCIIIRFLIQITEKINNKMKIIIFFNYFIFINKNITLIKIYLSLILNLIL